MNFPLDFNIRIADQLYPEKGKKVSEGLARLIKFPKPPETYFRFAW